MTLTCHFLIGPPGCGKSTFAKQLAKLGNYRIVSTDAIRAQLFGEEIIQGDWSAIEREAILQIRSCIAGGEAVIYDATNAKRAWRMDLLGKLLALGGQDNRGTLTRGALSKGEEAPVQGSSDRRRRVRGENSFPRSPASSPKPYTLHPTPFSDRVRWMAWYLQTPLETCKAWNQKRDRVVPPGVIEAMSKSLEHFPPVAAEGFAAVHSIDLAAGELNLEDIEAKIKRSSQNGTEHPQTLHAYSRLLDFDRLMHLISLTIRYPGLGTLHKTAPRLLKRIFDRVPRYATPLDEVSALMGKLSAQIYSDRPALAADLKFLTANGFLGRGGLSPLEPPAPGGQGREKIIIPTSDNLNLPPHAYSDLASFERLLQTIRFILNRPLLRDSGESSLETLVKALQEHRIIEGYKIDIVRQDIERVLLSFKILPDFPLPEGYFAGTAILSRYELRQLFQVLQSRAQSWDDPIALQSYHRFRERMSQSNLGDTELYPIRRVAHAPTVNVKWLGDTALPLNLPSNLEALEKAIAAGALLELSRISASGTLAGDEEGFFLAWPLQLVFYNSAWYLGWEYESDRQPGLFQFERLERLSLGQTRNKTRTKPEREQSLQKLQALQDASAGIFLGSSAREQRLFLSPENKERKTVEVTVELWFKNSTFQSILEATSRFPAGQVKMSPPVPGATKGSAKSIFSLSRTGDDLFPNRLRVNLPKWSLDDEDFLAWILGKGDRLKVAKPKELLTRVKDIGAQIVRLYQE